jgi:hypothetical protein
MNFLQSHCELFMNVLRASCKCLEILQTNYEALSKFLQVSHETLTYFSQTTYEPHMILFFTCFEILTNLI